MGFFTWTDAKRVPRKRRDGDFVQADVIGYDCYAKVVCPDNTEIIEPYYEGYGIFDGKDIYELVTEWNKDHLEEIFQKLTATQGWGCFLQPVAIAYQNGGDEAAQEAVKSCINKNNAQYAPYVETEWKRQIGIAIGCVSEMNKVIAPYPIKITSGKRKFKYDQLYPSLNTQ